MNKFWVCLGSMLATTFGVTPVFAQTNDASYELEEVVVTAELREVNLQKVSTSIQVTSGDELRKEGKKRIDEIMQGAVGIQMQDSQNGVSFFVRGVDGGGTGAGTVVSTPVIVDGVAQSRAEAVRGGTLDLARAEVMRGPQSTTLGANSLSGAVSLVSNKPVFEYQASTNLDVGNYHSTTMEGVMNVPLADNQAIRIAFTNSKRDGYYSNGAGNSDLSTTRIKYRWQPSDSLDITATVQHQNIGGNGVSQLTLLTYGSYKPWRNGDAFTSGSTLNQYSICQASLTDPTIVPCNQATKTAGAVVRQQESLTMLGSVPVFGTNSPQLCFPTGFTATGIPCSGQNKVLTTLGGQPDFLGVPPTYVPVADGTNFRTRTNAWDDGSQPLAWSNQPYRNSNIELASVEFNWQTDLGAVTFLPSYQSTHYTDRQPFRGYQAMGADNYQRTKIADLRINSNSGGALEWQAGLYYSDDRQNNSTFFMNAPGVGMAGMGSVDPGQCNYGAVDYTTLPSYGSNPYDTTLGQGTLTTATNGATPTAAVIPLVTLNPCYNWQLTPRIERLSKAIYFNSEYSALDNFRLIGGARFNDQTGRQSGAQVINGDQYGPFDTCYPNGVQVNLYVCNGSTVNLGTTASPNNQLKALDNMVLTGNSNRWTHTTYRAGFEWDVIPEAMVYGVYSTGFNPGTIDGMTGAVNKAVTLEQITAGFKSQALDNRLQFNAEAFFTTYHNRPVDGSVISYVGGADSSSCTVGMGQTALATPTFGTGYCMALGSPTVDAFKSMGIDMDMTWLISPVDRLNLTAEYMTATYDQKPVYSAATATQTVTGCSTIPDITYADGTITTEYLAWVGACMANLGFTSAVQGDAGAMPIGLLSDLKVGFDNQLEGFIGSTLQNAPKFSATWTYSHNFLLADGSRITPRISGVYKTKYWSLGGGGPGNSGVNVIMKAGSDPSSPYYLSWQQAYATWDASLAWDKSDGKFTVNAYVKNLTNEVVMSGFTYQYISLSPPRTYGATFTANF